MSSFNETVSKRIATGVISFMILALLLFSAFYIASEADHDCIGENCPVCICIEHCEKALHQVSHGALLQVAIVVPCAFLLISAFLLVFEAVHETLVSKKVRLNH